MTGCDLASHVPKLLHMAKWNCTWEERVLEEICTRLRYHERVGWLWAYEICCGIGYKGSICKDTVFIDGFIEKAKAKTVSPCLKLMQAGYTFQWGQGMVHPTALCILWEQIFARFLVYICPWQVQDSTQEQHIPSAVLYTMVVLQCSLVRSLPY